MLWIGGQMRISSKGRYALAAMALMAERFQSGEFTTVISISEHFGISKIYLEQVFSLMKRAGLVASAKGAQGGYQLTRKPSEINVFEVLHAAELSLFEQAEATVAEKSPEVDRALSELVFTPLDEAVRASLETVTLDKLAAEVEKNKGGGAIMFYI